MFKEISSYCDFIMNMKGNLLIYDLRAAGQIEKRNCNLLETPGAL